MSTTANDVIDRLLEIYGVSSDTDLCKILNIKSKSTLSSWRLRDSIPYAICVQVAADKDVSLDWILIGKKEKQANKDDLNERQKALLDNYENTDEFGKRIIEATASEAAQPAKKRVGSK